MEDALSHALDRINRRFYAAAAQAFDATRQGPWPGFVLVADRLASRAPGALRVLDLGCGNGRFARFLAARRPLAMLCGIDSSQELLALARAAGRVAPAEHWIAGDLTRSLPLRPDLKFACVALFGVVHHVATFAQRQTLLRRALERVAPGGLLAVTFWQLTGEEHLESRTLSNEAVRELLRSELPTEGMLPVLAPGDRIVTFGPERLPRFVHECDASERQQLLAALPAQVVAEFESDGRNGRGNVYVLLTPRD